MGANGVDVQLSTAGLKAFPYDIEAKNRESLKTLYGMYEQAAGQGQGGEPLLVLCMNRKKPLAVVDAEHFVRLVANQKDN